MASHSSPSGHADRSFAPLVSPGPTLTAGHAARYARHLSLASFSPEAQTRLLNARVAVVGAGGLGSPILLYLAASGVGTLGIIDDDTVDVSNLQRQVIHTEASVGASKVESAASAVRERNSAIRVVCHPVRLDSANALSVLRDYDLVVDGSDNFATKYLVGDAAEILGIPCVWGSILQDDGRATTFWSRPSDGLPGRSYRDLFPAPPPDGSVLNCAEAGVLGVLCASIGAAMATEVVNLITGRGVSLLGRLLTYNALRQSWREVPFLPDAGRQPVTALAPERPVVACAAPGPAEWSVEFLAERRERDSGPFDLIDVRPDHERLIASIPTARALDLAELLSGRLDDTLPREQPLVFVCHRGVRTAHLVRALRRRGLDNAFSVMGGIDAWSTRVDPGVPRY